MSEETHGLPGASVSIVGVDAGESRRVRVPTDDLREVRVLVSIPAVDVAKLTAPSTPFSFVLRDVESGTSSSRKTQFQTARGQKP